MTRGWLKEIGIRLRGFAKRPTFPALVVLALGLGMAVSLAALGIAKQVLLDPLPYEDAEGVVILHRSSEGGGRGGISWGALGDLQVSGLFRETAAVSMPRFDEAIVLEEGTYPERLPGLYVTPEFFDVLGVEPGQGRGFGSAAETGTEVVLSHAAWRSRFGGRNVIGETIRLKGEPRTIVGVLPPDVVFELAPEAQVFLSFRPSERLATNRDARVILGVARTDTRRSELRRRLERLDQRIEAAAPAVELPSLRAVPVRDFFYGNLTRPLLFLALAGMLTLLVAVVNVALLVLARIQRRRTENSIRVALGASRRRLLADPFTEALLLALVATGLGMAGAKALVAGLGALDPGGLSLVDGLSLDGTLTALALCLAGLSASLVAALPALRLGEIDLDALRKRTDTLSSGELQRWNVLVAGQTAMITLLLVAAALTGRSFMALLDVDPGFQADASYAVEFTLPSDEYDSRAAVARYLRRAEERLRSEPRIAAAGVTTNLPLTAGWSGELALRNDPGFGDGVTPVDWEMVSPGYFEAMGVSVVRGRAFRPADGPEAPRVAVVNETLAHRHWPDGGAVGAQVSGTGKEGPWVEVVGVVEDVRQDGLARDVEPMMYVSASQWFPPSVWQLVVRGRGPGANGAPTAAAEVLRALEPRVVLGATRPLSDLIRADTAPTRVQSALLGLFGGTALLLGLAGIFGVVSYAVARRRRELGVRMAMGARRRQVIARVLRSGLVPVLAGLGLGLAAALLASSVFGSRLYGVSPGDPVTYVTLPMVVLTAAVAALLLPAIRAAGVNPARVLSDE